MQTKCLLKFAAALLLLSTISHPLSTLFAQGTAFTYQGRLNSGGTPANGSYDIAFSLYATNTSGVAIAGPVTNSAVSVTNGLFTTPVDFGANAFTGTSNWLAIAVSTNGADAFISLSPRQQLTPVPYAITAANVDGISIQQNSDGAPNVILGSSGNSVSGGVVGATIGGGGTTNYFGNPYTNSVTADFGTVGGGYQNTASGIQATVAGGVDNTASGIGGTVGGGSYNTAGYQAMVPGGVGNTASGNYSFAAGYQAQATNKGAFVWADSQAVNFYSTNNDSFNVRAQGGARFVTSGAGLTVDGPVTATSLTGNGSGLTALNGSQITSGTVADARLSSNVPLLNAGNTYAGLNVYNNLIKVVGPVSNNGYFGFLEEDTSATGDFWILTKWDNVGNKRFSIYDGNGVTPIVLQEHGGNVGIGTNQPGALLEVNGNAQIDGPVTATSFSGNGSGLTALNGSQITSGTVADARLSSNVALRAGGNTFTGNQVINAGGAGVKVAGTAAPSTYFGSLISDGGPGDFWFLSAYNASGSKRNTIYGAGGSTPLVFQEQGGNVGIGITTPTNTLQVNGTVAASALRAPGAGVNTGTFAFTQLAVGTNTASNITTIYNPLTDGDPNAILIVTHNWTADTNSTSKYNTKPVGVYFDGAHWTIFNEDTTAMALGRAFNVMVIKN